MSMPSDVILSHRVATGTRKRFLAAFPSMTHFAITALAAASAALSVFLPRVAFSMSRSTQVPKRAMALSNRYAPSSSFTDSRTLGLSLYSLERFQIVHAFAELFTKGRQLTRPAHGPLEQESLVILG